jgi:hypothetical protein
LRVQLTARSVAALLLLSSPAHATDVAVSSKVQLYADNDKTVVVSPHVTATATLNSKTSISATYTEDVVSSASVDVRSSASPRIYDRRQELDVGVGQDIKGVQLGGSFSHSLERDYLSNGGSLTVSRDFFQKNLTASVRVGFMSNVVGRADDPLFQAPLTDWSSDLALTQTLTAKTLGQLNVTFAKSDGMNASPYRKVSVSGGRFVVPESEPASRTKLAAAVALKQYFGIFVGHVDYRFYWDTFQLLSHTIDARLVLDLGQLSLRLRYRFYVQNGAYFYKSSYDALQAYVSADRELSPFSSHLFGLKAEWSPRRTVRGGAQFRFDVKAEGMYFSYNDFPRLQTRWALITQAGLAVDF